MATTQTVTFSLVLELDREPVSGRLRGPDGFERGFEGLLSLLAALDAAREVAAQPGPRPPS